MRRFLSRLGNWIGLGLVSRGLGGPASGVAPLPPVPGCVSVEMGYATTVDIGDDYATYVDIEMGHATTVTMTPGCIC